MAKNESERQPIHWAMKLLATMLVGGLFAIGVFFIPADALAIPQAIFGPLCVTMIVVSATMCGSFLYRREGNGWRRSLMMGFVVGLAGSAIIMMIGFLFVIWLVSNIQLV